MLGPGMTLVGTPVALSYSLHVLGSEGRRPLHVASVILAAIAALLVVTWLVVVVGGLAGWLPTGGSSGPGPRSSEPASCDCETVPEPLRSFEVRLGRVENAPGLVEAARPWGRGSVFLEPEPLLTLDDVVTVAVQRTQPGNATALSIVLTPAAADRLSRATGASLGRPMALLLDDRVVYDSQVLAEIRDSFVLWPAFGIDDCCRLQCAVEKRNATSAPAPP